MNTETNSAITGHTGTQRKYRADDVHEIRLGGARPGVMFHHEPTGTALTVFFKEERQVPRFTAKRMLQLAVTEYYANCPSPTNLEILEHAAKQP